jgi:crotonobetainyl-CoA:carnitine CoA-transferase CaiB-like acyl-CoA transferase
MKLLAGVRVLDLGGFITAPFAAMVLAELGADVIKVERPGEGDPFRAFKQGRYSPHFQAHNRNKRSITLDFTKPDGRAILKDLVRKADAIVMNNRPGVAEKLGIGYDALREVNPRLVYCSITGFGETGPYADRPAFDNVGQALSGWMSRYRQPNDDPRVVGPAVSDAATGYQAAMGILAALYERHATGKGRRIDVSMIEATIHLGAEPLGQYLATGEPVPVYQRAAMSQAYNLVCADGKRIGLHLSSPDKFWASFCSAIDRADWIAKYPKRMDRVTHYESLAIEIAAVFKTKSRAQWVTILEAADVPFAPELALEELASDPHIAHLDVFYETTHPKYGPVRAPHRAIRADGSRAIDHRPPPDLGEHTDEVLRELGLDAARLAELRAKGLV